MAKTEKPPVFHLPLMIFLLWFVAPGPAWANVSMAPFFSFVKIAYWWVILLALLIETAALRYLFRMDWTSAAMAALSINVISLLCGLTFYPLVAALGYALLEEMIVDLFGASDHVEISALWIGAAFVDTWVELLALKWIFSRRSSFGQGFFFMLANLASAGVLVGIMVWQAHIPDMSAEEAAAVEMEYAAEISFLNKMLEAFPEHVVVTNPKGGPRIRLDGRWTNPLLIELATLRIRTMSLEIPPTTVWMKGSTALWEVGARFKDGKRTIDKGLVDTVLLGNEFRPTGLQHYRYRVEREVNGKVYAIQAILKN